MLTEEISPRYLDLDSGSSDEMIPAMYESQLAAAAAVHGALDAIAAAVDAGFRRCGGAVVSSMSGLARPVASACRTDRVDSDL
jgi:N-acetylmuramic acid 6-phosphate etherase